MNMRALIVDDEALARAALSRLLKQDGDITIVGECGDGEAAVKSIRKMKPDVVFLDVQMPEMDGFQVIECVGVEEMPATIFVTAYDKYAMRAFDASAVDYLLKPFLPDRLSRALARARDRWQNRQDKDAAKRLFALLDNRYPSDYIRRIAVASGGRIVFVAVEEIDWIGAEDNYARLHVGRNVYEVRETLQALMEKLDPGEFLRVHRSTIVNVRRIREVQPWFQGSHIIVLRSGETLRMSRYQKVAVDRLLGKRDFHGR
jgi:two-component system, LytTR family, response regulator